MAMMKLLLKIIFLNGFCLVSGHVERSSVHQRSDPDSSNTSRPMQLERLTQLMNNLETDVQQQHQFVRQALGALSEKVDQQNQAIAALDQTLGLQQETFQQVSNMLHQMRPANPCPQLNVSNAKLSAYNPLFQSSVTLTCLPGYQLSENVTTVVVTCNADGTWSPQPMPVCHGKRLQPSLTYSIPGTVGVMALAVVNEHLYVTRQGSDQIEIYDTETHEFKGTITVPEVDNFLFGLAPCPAVDNCFYLSDYMNMKIYKVDLTKTAINSTATATSWSVLGMPIGLSVNGLQNVLVTFRFKISEYTPSGDVVRETSQFVSDRRRYHLWHAVERNNDGTIAVSLGEPVYGVYLVSVDGQVLRRYGNETRGSAPGSMGGPRSLAVDKEGFILAADSHNGRILVLNPTLTDATSLTLSEELSDVTGLWFDESRGRLYVGESRYPYRVLVFDDVVNLRAAFFP